MREKKEIYIGKYIIMAIGIIVIVGILAIWFFAPRDEPAVEERVGGYGPDSMRVVWIEDSVSTWDLDLYKFDDLFDGDTTLQYEFKAVKPRHSDPDSGLKDFRRER